MVRPGPYAPGAWSVKEGAVGVAGDPALARPDATSQAPPIPKLVHCLAVLLAACGASRPEPAEPSGAGACSVDLASAAAQGGVCLQPSVIGEAAVEACEADLRARGWAPDGAASAVIGEQMGEPIRCWHAP